MKILYVSKSEKELHNEFIIYYMPNTYQIFFLLSFTSVDEEVNIWCVTYNVFVV